MEKVYKNGEIAIDIKEFPESFSIRLGTGEGLPGVRALEISSGGYFFKRKNKEQLCYYIQ